MLLTTRISILTKHYSILETHNQSIDIFEVYIKFVDI